MWIVGIVLVAAGVGLFFASRSQGDKVMQMKATETSKVSALKELSGQIAKEIGPGGVAQAAEVKGTIVCPSPLNAECSNKPCVYYSVSVTREYEETFTERDSEGRSRTGTRRGSETVSSNERRVPFGVDDGTGTINVDPEGAKIDAEKTFSEFRQGESQGANFKFGSFSFNVGGLAIGPGRRTLGYKFEEWSVPVGRAVYILGEARDSGGELKIARPSEKGKTFLISLKSEEELVRSAEGASKWMKIGAIAAAVVGIVLIVVGLFSR